MKIVLLERITKLGQMGDIVEVKSGFARNFLLPNGKALRATNQNIQFFEDRKTELVAKNLTNKKEAETIKAKMDNQIFVLIRSASDTGALYGSVSSKDIKEVASTKGFEVSKNQICLVKPIKQLGIYHIDVNLHPEITSRISVNVARTQEEAKLQEKGNKVEEKKSNQGANEKLELKNLFDDEEMASKIENDNENTDILSKEPLKVEEPDSDNDTQSS